MKVRHIFSVAVIFYAFSITLKAQNHKDFPYYHDWEFMPFTVSAYTGTDNMYKIDFPQVRVRILNLGLYSCFSYTTSYGYENSIFTTNKLDYLLPVGIHIPVKQNKNMQWTVGSNFYWTRIPYIIEAEFRMEYRFFSFMAGYRYIDYNPDSRNVFYVGISAGYHHFFNRRRLSGHKRTEIQNALGFSDFVNYYDLDFTKDGYMLLSANLREGIDYNSTLTFIEDSPQKSIFLDSLCTSRSVEILKILKSKTEITEINGLKVSIYYGGFAPEVRYDYGTSNVQRFPNLGAYPNTENTYNGSSKTFNVLDSRFIYSVKMKLNDYNTLEQKDESENVLKKCEVDNQIQNYLKQSSALKKNKL